MYVPYCLVCRERVDCSQCHARQVTGRSRVLSVILKLLLHYSVCASPLLFQHANSLMKHGTWGTARLPLAWEKETTLNCPAWLALLSKWNSVSTVSPLQNTSTKPVAVKSLSVSVSTGAGEFLILVLCSAEERWVCVVSIPVMFILIPLVVMKQKSQLDHWLLRVGKSVLARLIFLYQTVISGLPVSE